MLVHACISMLKSLFRDGESVIFCSMQRQLALTLVLKIMKVKGQAFCEGIGFLNKWLSYSFSGYRLMCSY